MKQKKIWKMDREHYRLLTLLRGISIKSLFDFIYHNLKVLMIFKAKKYMIWGSHSPKQYANHKSRKRTTLLLI